MLITGFRYLRLVLCKYTYLYSSHRLYQTVQQGSPAGRSRPIDPRRERPSPALGPA